MASDEPLSFEPLLREYIFVYGEAIFSYHTMEIEAFLVTTLDDNACARNIIKVYDVTSSNKHKEEENPSEDTALKKNLEMLLKSHIQKTNGFIKCLKVDGIVTYKLNEEKCYVIKLDFEVSFSNETKCGIISSSATSTEHNGNDSKRRKVTSQNAEYPNRSLEFVSQVTKTTRQPAARKRSHTITQSSARSQVIGNDQPVASTNISTRININYSKDENGSASFDNNTSTSDVGMELLNDGNEDDPYVKWAKAEKVLSNNGDTKKYYTKNLYDILNVKVNDQKDVRCKDCHETFSCIQSLQIHAFGKHTRQTCLVCGLLFSNKANLKRHVFGKHMSFTFNCKECNKKYSTKDALQWHVRTHYVK